MSSVRRVVSYARVESAVGHRNVSDSYRAPSSFIIVPVRRGLSCRPAALLRARALTRGSIGMSAEARRSWHPAFARWGGEKSEADAAKAAATRRPTRVGFARIAESVVPDARVATPAPLFELALKCVPRSRARDPSPNARRHVSARLPRARSSGTAKRARARPHLHAVVATEP